MVRSVSIHDIDHIKDNKLYHTQIPLVIHDVEFTDELINPIAPAENAYSFISIDSVSSLKYDAVSSF